MPSRFYVYLEAVCGAFSLLIVEECSLPGALMHLAVPCQDCCHPDQCLVCNNVSHGLPEVISLL